jgi:hypothetical protein
MHAQEPDDRLRLAEALPGTASSRPPPGRAKERQEGAVILDHKRYPPVLAPPYELESAGRLAVHHIKGTLRVQSTKERQGACEPARVVKGEPGVPSGSVDEVPRDPVAPLVANALGMPSRDHLDVLARGCEPSSQVAGVILHAADTVAGDGDDAYAQERWLPGRYFRVLSFSTMKSPIASASIPLM